MKAKYSEKHESSNIRIIIARIHGSVVSSWRSFAQSIMYICM